MDVGRMRGWVVHLKVKEVFENKKLITKGARNSFER